MLSLAGCTLQHGFFTGKTSGLDDYAVRPVARFPAYDRGCQEMPDGSCEVGPTTPSAGPAAQAPRPIGSAPKTFQQQQSGPPPGIATVTSPSPTILLAEAPPVEAPASKPDGDAGKTSDGLTDAAIVALIIQASREAYYTSGHSCPCPYDLAPNGRLCGRHSAHSRPRAAMRCFTADVTADQIAEYRAKLALKVTASWRRAADAIE